MAFKILRKERQIKLSSQKRCSNLEEKIIDFGNISRWNQIYEEVT